MDLMKFFSYLALLLSTKNTCRAMENNITKELEFVEDRAKAALTLQHLCNWAPLSMKGPLNKNAIECDEKCGRNLAFLLPDRKRLICYTTEEPANVFSHYVSNKGKWASRMVCECGAVAHAPRGKGNTPKRYTCENIPYKIKAIRYPHQSCTMLCSQVKVFVTKGPPNSNLEWCDEGELNSIFKTVRLDGVVTRRIVNNRIKSKCWCGLGVGQIKPSIVPMPTVGMEYWLKIGLESSVETEDLLFSTLKDLELNTKISRKNLSNKERVSERNEIYTSSDVTVKSNLEKTKQSITFLEDKSLPIIEKTKSRNEIDYTRDVTGPGNQEKTKQSISLLENANLSISEENALGRNKMIYNCSKEAGPSNRGKIKNYIQFLERESFPFVQKASRGNEMCYSHSSSNQEKTKQYIPFLEGKILPIREKASRKNKMIYNCSEVARLGNLEKQENLVKAQNNSSNIVPMYYNFVQSNPRIKDCNKTNKMGKDTLRISKSDLQLSLGSISCKPEGRILEILEDDLGLTLESSNQNKTLNKSVKKLEKKGTLETFHNNNVDLNSFPQTSNFHSDKTGLETTNKKVFQDFSTLDINLVESSTNMDENQKKKN